MLALAASAEVSREAATWFGLRGPVCPLGHLFGECVCPGCGLTRATAMVVQGRFHDALATNPAGFVVAGLCAAALLLQLDVVRRGRVLGVHTALSRYGRVVFVSGILSAWLLRAAGWC